MQRINKFSNLKSEEQRIVESIKNDYGQMAIDIAKKMGFSSLEEVAKQKQVLSKLESLLKDLPSKSDVSEDRAKDIEDDINKKGEPKSEEDGDAKKEAKGKTGAGNEVAESKEEEDDKKEPKEDDKKEPKEDDKKEPKEDDKKEPKKDDKKEPEEEIEEEINSKDNSNPGGYPPPGGNSDDVKSHRIKKFEDFIKESEDISITESSTVPTFSRFLSETKNDAFIEVDLEIGDGEKTADDIEDAINKKGEPKTAKEDKSLIAEDKAEEIEAKINVLGEPKTLTGEDDIIEEKIILEEDIASDEDFKSYALTVLKKAFGEDYDEDKANDVVSGLIDKYSGDYGAMIGALQSSLD